ncbi:hypothetical protein CBL_04349 [Carabus blaptoides fortunei]
MNVTTEEVINIISELAKHENLRVTLKESLQGGLITGLCTTAGGLLGGRTGLLLGGAIGTALGLYVANDFKSVVYIIRHEMTSEDRALLADSMKKILLRTSAPYSLYKIVSNENLRILGALLGGRNGFLLGSAIGMSAASYMSDMKYVSVASLIADYMTPVQVNFRQQVVSFIRGFIQELGLTLA